MLYFYGRIPPSRFREKHSERFIIWKLCCMNSCCSCCFESSIGACIPADGQLSINTQLDPSKNYWYHITDKFSNEYSGEVTPLSNGTIQIPLADLPDGLFNQHAGNFILTITEDEQGCTTVPLLLAVKYECIQITAIGKNSNSSIGCEITTPITTHEFAENEFSDEFN